MEQDSYMSSKVSLNIKLLKFLRISSCVTTVTQFFIHVLKYWTADLQWPFDAILAHHLFCNFWSLDSYIPQVFLFFMYTIYYIGLFHIS